MGGSYDIGFATKSMNSFSNPFRSLRSILQCIVARNLCSFVILLVGFSAWIALQISSFFACKKPSRSKHQLPNPKLRAKTEAACFSRAKRLKRRTRRSQSRTSPPIKNPGREPEVRAFCWLSRWQKPGTKSQYISTRDSWRILFCKIQMGHRNWQISLAKNFDIHPTWSIL